MEEAYVFFEDVPDAFCSIVRYLQTAKKKYRDASGRLCMLDIWAFFISASIDGGSFIVACNTCLQKAGIHSQGFDSIQALERFYNGRISLRYNPMRNLLTEAVIKNNIQEIDDISGDVLYKFRAKCIARSKSLNKAMVVASLSTFKESAEVKDASALMRYASRCTPPTSM